MALDRKGMSHGKSQEHDSRHRLSSFYTAYSLMPIFSALALSLPTCDLTTLDNDDDDDDDDDPDHCHQTLLPYNHDQQHGFAKLWDHLPMS
jgi:hypothetical protein